MPDLRPNWGHIASKALARLRARGPAEVASLVSRRGLAALWSQDRLIILVRDAGGQPSEAPGLLLREATAADGRRYARDIGTDSPLTFAARLRSGATCWLVESAGRILHTTWMTRDGAWTREIARCLRPPEGDAYVYESFTRADARGRGLYPFALNGICARVAEHGVKRVWVGVENRNLPSLRAVTKAGFEGAFEVSYRRRVGRLSVDGPVDRCAGSPQSLRLAPTC